MHVWECECVCGCMRARTGECAYARARGMHTVHACIHSRPHHCMFMRRCMRDLMHAHARSECTTRVASSSLIQWCQHSLMRPSQGSFRCHSMAQSSFLMPVSLASSLRPHPSSACRSLSSPPPHPHSPVASTPQGTSPRTHLTAASRSLTHQRPQSAQRGRRGRSGRPAATWH